MAITEKGEAVVTHDLEAPTPPNEGIGDATQQDEIDMHRLGRKPQLKRQRNFHAISILGLTSMTMISWTGGFTALAFTYTNGGRAVISQFIFGDPTVLTPNQNTKMHRYKGGFSAHQNISQNG
ncbi:hypothetical protein BDY17DRAFT_308309 [Neohortaea acidophila]|uniref:Uncharacterized protein n=1 Tax=Neohortaea acidophila TaxID=245834 RepID=A0A6A6Q6E4_9PEZI|nr:uncharacterized protein BDY17DRAFT_308309 [Neohortaea acidophila]KAF2486967.1 hypothetical protein BDY17DRAFT_308309 [Neohortaea acidophila]